jgi:hypothetical protein
MPESSSYKLPHSSEQQKHQKPRNSTINFFPLCTHLSGWLASIIFFLSNEKKSVKKYLIKTSEQQIQYFPRRK